MYEHSRKSQDLAARLQRFMDEHIYPNEEAYAHQLKTAENRFAPLPLMDELKLKAKEAGLWNSLSLRSMLSTAIMVVCRFSITRHWPRSWDG